ncbi:MAG: glycosyltransferase [Ruminococcaceae bacterium]|nr:glycosyltransferase [Oscillospiraceae bacterium]
MKILHLLQSNRFSGAENVVCQIVNMFKDYPDIEMVYCSCDGQIREALAERGITFVPLKKLCFSEVKRVIEEQKPDIIHAHDMGAGFNAAMVCKKTNLISHIHNNNFDSRGISLKSLAFLLVGIKAKHIFWVSKSSFEGYFFHKIFKGKSSVLHNIIDKQALYSKMSECEHPYNYDVAYVGRLTYQKNPERLMGVLKKAKEHMHNIKVAIVGAGDLEENTKKLCQEYGLQGNVNFLGFMNNPLKVLYNSKVMVMTSRWEGLPMCALEAMALGTPIVSTPTDGMIDIIEDGVNGYLSDDDDVLADRIVKIVQNNELYEKLSSETILKFDEFCNIELYKETILDLYNKLK